MRPGFWRGRRIFVTGHTGFKGAWLCRWLQRHDAVVTGYALAPPTSPSLFVEAGVAHGMTSVDGDVRDLASLRSVLEASRPEIVIHMAAQSLVRQSYDSPVETYATNVMGTVHLLEAVRGAPSVRVVINVTSDKCYENREWHWAYRENEPMGGKDPYSSSKGCSELVTAAYRASFFREPSAPRIATARAGNVIGGGDWAPDRLVPDLLRAFASGVPAAIRSPQAIRPWQFVLDPLAGYLALAEALWEDGTFAGGWNFGPSTVHPVSWVVERLTTAWGPDATWHLVTKGQPPEALTLRLDSARAQGLLRWSPRVETERAVEWIATFHKGWLAKPSEARALMDRQIAHFEELSR